MYRFCMNIRWQLAITWEEKGTLENPTTETLVHRVYLRLRLKQQNQERIALTTSNKF